MGVDQITLSVAKGYVKETVLGGGAVVGKNVTISSITPIDGGNRITFSYEWCKRSRWKRWKEWC